MENYFQKYKKVLIIFLIWFFVVNFFAVLFLNRFNLNQDTAYNWISYNDFGQEKSWDLIDLHSRWDSVWYLDIAQNGYSFNQSSQLSNIVFFPLYPFLVYLFSFIFLGNYVLAGWVVSGIFLFLSLIYLFKIVEEFHKNSNPLLAIIFLLLFPTAFFLNTVYTESLFLFLSLVTFYYALKKNFLYAGVFGLFASLTRITGVLLFIPVLWEYFKAHDYNFKKFFSVKILPIFFIPVGVLSFFLYHYLKFGNIFLFFKIQENWGRNFSFQGDHFKLLSSAATSNFLLDAFFVIFILLATYFVFKKIRISYGFYMLASVLIALSTGTTMSIGRYILVLFPIYILLGSVKNEYVKYAWGLISILLFSMYTILFVNNYWAG